MTKKTCIVTCILLLFLLTSLFSALSMQTVKAINPLYDVFALKEYKQWSSYNPSYTFSKPSSGVLQMMSTQNGLGDAYAFMHIDRDYLHGHKIRIHWRWYYDWSSGSNTLANVYVVNNIDNRKLEASGEFATYNDAEHPVTDFTHTTACSLTQSCNGGWISWQTDTSSVLNLAGWNSQVTIMIKNVDYWTANTVGLQVDYLQILDSNNNVVRQYDFNDPVCMDKTGGYYDYGQLRNPTSMLYGTRDYAGMDAPAGELDLSGSVSSYIYTLFSNTGKYGYLANSWGDNTEPATVYSTTDSTERYYDYSTVFYKGHVWPFGDWCDHDPSCNLVHWGVWNDDGTVGIADYDIDDEVIEVISDTGKFAGTHDFVFMWACGLGADDRVGTFDEQHSSGVLAAWMHLDPNTLSSNGYSSPDYSDHVFIGFEWLSIWYKTPATNPTYNYGHWAYLFYYYALTQGYTVKDALDQASRDTHYNNNYDNCPLDNSYLGWNPISGEWEESRMRVWGDGYARLPR